MQQRFEYKYMLNLNQFAQVLEKLALEKYVVLSLEDKYVFHYKNLYYDTKNLSFFKMW
ncbi:MAG: hypothetical protein ACOZBL_04950 [Patescibacteria group bacterium]